MFRQNELIPSCIDDIIANVGNQYQRKAENWFSENKDSGDDKEEPEAVFSVLDEMIKGSLDRLKTMRLALYFLHEWKLCFIENLYV